MSTKYTTYESGNGKGTYHTAKDCERIHNPEKLAPRSDTYIEWHGLSPCEYCCDVNDDPFPNVPESNDRDHYESLVEASHDD